MKTHQSSYKLSGESMLQKISKMKFQILIGKYIAQMVYRRKIVGHLYKQRRLICGLRWKKEFKIKDHDFQDNGCINKLLWCRCPASSRYNRIKTPSSVKEEKIAYLQIIWSWRIHMISQKSTNSIQRQKISLLKFPLWRMVSILLSNSSESFNFVLLAVNSKKLYGKIITTLSNLLKIS